MVRKNRRIALFMAAISISLISCKDKIDAPVPEQETPVKDCMEITFYGSHAPYSKTVLNDEAVLWETGDEVKVLWGDNKFYKSYVTPYNSSANAEFKAEVEDAAAYYGVYPYSAASSLVDNRLTVTVPQTQTGLFADAGITVAKADAENMMKFRHIVSYLEFSIDKPGTLTISGGKPLVGDVTVSEFDENGITDYSVSEGASSVIVDVKASGTYYVALLPDAKFDYLLLSLDDGDSVFSAFSTNKISMQPGKLLALGNVTGRFKSGNALGATLEPFEIIDFSFETSAVSF